MTTSPLLAELSLHEYVRAQLAAQFPDADEETLADTLEGLTDLREMLARVVRSFLDDRAMSEGLKLRIAEMQERLKRLEHRVTVKRELVTHVMERASIDKLVQADFSASLRPTPRPLVVSDEAAIPTEYWIPQPAKLDRKGLGDRLKAGMAIPGALLGNGGVSVAVRVR